MPWLILVLAGLFEIGWAIGLKYTDGFTKPWPTVGTVASMIGWKLTLSKWTCALFQ